MTVKIKTYEFYELTEDEQIQCITILNNRNISKYVIVKVEGYYGIIDLNVLEHVFCFDENRTYPMQIYKPVLEFIK